MDHNSSEATSAESSNISGNTRRRSRLDLLSEPELSVGKRPRLGLAGRASVASLVIPGEHVPPTLAAREIDVTKLTFLFKKELKKSDVGVLKRVVLPKKESETHLPILEAKEGMLMRMVDMDGIHSWNFKYRYWPNNTSRMYVLQFTGEFVQEHGLGADDSILIYKNVEDGEYVIEARKKVEDDARSLCVDNYNYSGMCQLSNELTIPVLPVFGNTSDYQYVYESTYIDDHSPFLDLPITGSQSSFDDFNVEDFELD